MTENVKIILRPLQFSSWITKLGSASAGESPHTPARTFVESSWARQRRVRWQPKPRLTMSRTNASIAELNRSFRVPTFAKHPWVSCSPPCCAARCFWGIAGTCFDVAHMCLQLLCHGCDLLNSSSASRVSLLRCRREKLLLNSGDGGSFNCYATHSEDGIRLFNIYWFYDQSEELRKVCLLGAFGTVTTPPGSARKVIKSLVKTWFQFKFCSCHRKAR